MEKNVQKNIYLIIETLGIFVAISILSVLLFNTNLAKPLKYVLYAPILLFQGLWFYRFYIVGHEASHRKLFAQNKRLNDFWGTVVLLPLMVPINIYRKIHLFHHGFNRKDNHTSVLDTFTTKKMSIFKKIYFYTLWYVAVFCGGFFIHSLVSVLLFLFIPPQFAPKISPAFEGWNMQEQLKAIALFTLGVGFHVAVYQAFGKMNYGLVLGLPMLSFAWVLSLLVYIFHYDTTVGDEVRYNVRSVKRVPIISWILMNFNEHATHHQHPNIPWYELPEKSKPLPEQFAHQNQNTDSFFKAIINQLKGPRIVHEQENQNFDNH